ncbi:MAG: PCMD domain-containing protein, partial [Rikenellaceae bacterium]
IFSSLTSDVVNYDYDNNLLTVSSEVFEGSAWGGVQEVDIQAINDGGSMGVTHMSIAVTGFSGLTSEDFWGNTATFNVYTTYSGISEIKVRYRYSGDTSWSSYMTAEQVSSNTWSVQNTSEWSEGTNGSGLTIYNLTRGILPSKDYEVQISIDGVESDIAEVTSSATTQTVTYGNLNDSSMSCFTTSNSGSTSWASGNNSTTSSLCTYFSSGNYAGVYMKTTSAAGVLAAGNLFTGVFSMSGTLNSTGNASFGQAFEWLARPTSLKVTYKAAPRSDDKGRVFIALVDWSSRQTVSVNGLSSTVSGIWDPETTDSVISDNDIIGYGSVLFGETTSDFAEVTVPINYYNKITKPDNTYTIVISCTASYKGDYLEGTEDSELWIDNIEFGY